MSAPLVTVTLTTPTRTDDVSALIGIDSAPEITEAIEAPAEVNRFVAPDVSLKINDDPKAPWVIALFETITPTATDWYVTVTCDGYQRFAGYILPNTVQIDDTERWVSFTAIGLAGKLSTTSAEIDALQRPVGQGWTVNSAVGDLPTAVVTITHPGGPRSSCEFVAGDILSFAVGGGDADEATVQGIAPVGNSSPYTYWTLIVSDMEQLYPAGTVIDLVTPWKRNIAVKTVVDALYTAAGLPPTVNGTTYRVSQISGALAPFASVPNYDGLTGAPLGLGPHADLVPSLRRLWPVVGTESGTFRQLNPPLDPWTLEEMAPQGAASYPVDWSAQGDGSYMLYGPRHTETPVGPDGIKHVFWAYDYTATAGGPWRRWGLSLILDNVAGELGPTFPWSYEILSEISYDRSTWTTLGGPYAYAAGTTETQITGEVYQTCGAEVFAGFVVFTAPKVGVTGQIEYSTSVFDIGSLTPVLDAYTYRGPVAAITSSVMGVFSVDALRGNVPAAYLFTRTGGGSGFTYTTSVPIPAGMAPLTLKFNQGDGYYYALSATEAEGVRLLSFADANLGERVGWVAPSLFPPSPLYVASTLDLCVVRPPDYVSGAYPMFGLFGNQVWWIALSYAGILQYADMEGLSCGDALAQLATLVDAFFYVDRNGTSWFKSRSLASGQTIATGRPIASTRIDDSGCLSLRRSGVWYKACRYVTVVNENDDTIVGTAGDPAFVGNELALEIANRFVYPQSFAIALAQHLFAYLGGAITAVDVEHLDDGRDYSIGNSFTASVGGSVMTLQIIDTTHRPAAATVRVQGIEI